MHLQVACSCKSLFTTRELAGKGLLTCVGTNVYFQISRAACSIPHPSQVHGKLFLPSGAHGKHISSSGFFRSFPQSERGLLNTARPYFSQDSALAQCLLGCSPLASKQNKRARNKGHDWGQPNFSSGGNESDFGTDGKSEGPVWFHVFGLSAVIQTMMRNKPVAITPPRLGNIG